MLLLRLSGLFLLRFAERRFSGLLFQEPPRSGDDVFRIDRLGLVPADINWQPARDRGIGEGEADEGAADRRRRADFCHRRAERGDE